MVFHYDCCDSRYIVYMGRDKYENEKLIEYGWPEDVWFHVSKLSSAHVYLRLPKGSDISSIPEEVITEMAQLTKANSIEGCKAASVEIVYTPWANLRKDAGMDVGQVGFHSNKLVHNLRISKNNEIVKRLEKTKKESDPDFQALREARDREERSAQKAAQQAHKQEDKRRKAEKLEEAAAQEERWQAKVSECAAAEDFLDGLDSSDDEGSGTQQQQSTARTHGSLFRISDQGGVMSVKKMEQLTTTAQDRKDAARQKAAEKRKAEEERRLAAEAEAQAAAERKQREQAEARQRAQEEALRKAEETAAELSQALEGVQLSPEQHEANAEEQANELLLLQAMFPEEVEQTSAAEFNLKLGLPCGSVALHVSYPPEYPSHLPPRCSITGATAAQNADLENGLRGLFSPGELVVHEWTQWLTDPTNPLAQ